MSELYCKTFLISEKKASMSEDDFKEFYNNLYRSQENTSDKIYKEYEKVYFDSYISDFFIDNYETYMNNIKKTKYDIVIGYNYENDDFCGAATISIYRSYIYINTLFTFNMNVGVEPYKGIGRALINKIKSLLTEEQYGIILDPLENAQKFYEKVGFSFVGGIYFSYLDDKCMFYKNPIFNNKLDKPNQIFDSCLEYGNLQFLFDLVKDKDLNFNDIYDNILGDYSYLFILLFIDKIDTSLYNIENLIEETNIIFRLAKDVFNEDSKYENFKIRCCEIYNIIHKELNLETELDMNEKIQLKLKLLTSYNKEKSNELLETLVITDLLKDNLEVKQEEKILKSLFNMKLTTSLRDIVIERIQKSKNPYLKKLKHKIHRLEKISDGNIVILRRKIQLYS